MLARSEACKAREQFSGQFADVDNKTDNVSLKAHYSSVDTVLLINDGSLLLSGSRDRSMVSLPCWAWIVLGCEVTEYWPLTCVRL